MSKTKKIIFYIICALSIFAAGFGAGRGLRLARVSGAGSELESGIISAGESADSIKDGLNTSGNLANSAASAGSAIIEGLGSLEQSTRKLGIFYDEVIRAIEADSEAEAAFRRAHSSSVGASVSALDIAIQHSEQYERLIDALQRAVKNSEENSIKPE